MAFRKYLSKAYERIRSQAAATSRFLHLRRVADVINSPVSRFKHKVAATSIASCFVLSMDQDPSFQRRQLAKIERHKLKPFIRSRHSVNSQSFLTVSTSLHGSQHIFEILAYAPSVCIDGLSQPH